MADRVDTRIIPPSIHDERSRAFGEAIRQALADPDFRRLLFEWLDTVDPRLFPFLIREFGLQHFVDPGMTEAVIRRLLKGSFELHRKMGFITGVRAGLEMLGISITNWSQWFQQTPKGDAGTHIAVISVDDEVFVDEGRAITARLQRAIGRMVARMQRKSQFVAIRFTTGGAGGGGPDDIASRTRVHVGAAVITRLRVSPTTEPITTLTARPSLFVGVAVSSRIRISPRIA